MTPKEELHQLVEELPEEEWRAALRYLEFLRDRGSDPVVAALEGAPDNGLLTEEDLEALEDKPAS
jgi:hypothetical protein